MTITNPLQGLASAVLFANLRSSDAQLAYSSFIELKDRRIDPRIVDPKNPLGTKSTADLIRLQVTGPTQLIRYAAYRQEVQSARFYEIAKSHPRGRFDVNAAARGVHGSSEAQAYIRKMTETQPV